MARAFRRGADASHQSGTSPLLVSLFATLADPVRLRLIGCIQRHERTGAECAALTGLPVDRVRLELDYLRESGCVTSRQVRGWEYFRALDDARFHQMRALARSFAAHHVSALTGCTSIDEDM